MPVLFKIELLREGQPDKFLALVPQLTRAAVRDCLPNNYLVAFARQFTRVEFEDGAVVLFHLLSKENNKRHGHKQRVLATIKVTRIET